MTVSLYHLCCSTIFILWSEERFFESDHSALLASSIVLLKPFLFYLLTSGDNFFIFHYLAKSSLLSFLFTKENGSSLMATLSFTFIDSLHINYSKLCNIRRQKINVGFGLPLATKYSI